MQGNQTVGGLAGEHRHRTQAGAVVGIDLGGTKILAGIADLQGQILATLREPTEHGSNAPGPVGRAGSADRVGWALRSGARRAG